MIPRMVQPASSVNKCPRKIYREAPQKETFLFETNGPNVGGWGRVVPNFYKLLFYGTFGIFNVKGWVGEFHDKTGLP